MFNKVLIVAGFVAVFNEVGGMIADQYNSLHHCSSERIVECFPLTTEILGRHNPTLWKTIAEFRKHVKNKSGKEYYDAIVESAKAIASQDLRFAALIEIGNLAAINGDNVAFQKAKGYLTKIIGSVDPNIALIGLKNQMLSYCFAERDKHIPNHMECWNNRGALEIFIQLASGIKGGDKSVRKETADLCRIFLQELREFEKK